MMRKGSPFSPPFFLLAFVFVGVTYLPQRASSEEIKKGMTSLLKPLRQLQPYLVDQQSFISPSNQEVILQLLRQLRSGFHTLGEVPSRYHRTPGFDANLQQVSDILDDSLNRLQDKRAAYAWWRSRTLPSACFSCHATYKVSASYSNEEVIDPSLNVLDRARYLLATRQFTQAAEVLQDVLRDPNQRFYFGEALRSLLVVEIRIGQNPAHAAEVFRHLLETVTLPDEESEHVRDWLTTLDTWAKEKSPPQGGSPLQQGEALITAGISNSSNNRDNPVSLLRGTLLLHTALEAEEIPSEERRRALLLLGAAYSRMPLFFAERWSEMYLEQCISEFGGTNEAKHAFSTYEEHVVADFTGSKGASLPEDVKLRIEKLRAIAYGERSIATTQSARP